MSSAGMAKVISTELLDNKDAKWINLVKITYEDEKGQTRTWEAMRRPTRPKTSAVDAVQILAVRQRQCRSPDDTGKSVKAEVLLEKQFRAPVGRVVVELPAGLVDEGETVEEAALRELREETGYVGEVVPDRGGGKRPIFFSSPASSSSCTYMIHLRIDPEREENVSPKPELEDGEFIECFWVPFDELHDECRRLESRGFAIDGKLGAFAEGLEVARALKYS